MPWIPVCSCIHIFYFDRTYFHSSNRDKPEESFKYWTWAGIWLSPSQFLHSRLVTAAENNSNAEQSSADLLKTRHRILLGYPIGPPVRHHSFLFQLSGMVPSFDTAASVASRKEWTRVQNAVPCSLSLGLKAVHLSRNCESITIRGRAWVFAFATNKEVYYCDMITAFAKHSALKTFYETPKEQYEMKFYSGYF